MVKTAMSSAMSDTQGYSTKENANNIEVPHLHLGMQLILMNFKEQQRNMDCLYPLTMLWRT
ncbi:MAG: hypothetical protein ACLTE2_10085 [Eubacteriales bacterium]